MKSKADFGFKADSLLLVPLHLDLSGYSGAQARQFSSELSGRLQSLPGIHSASRALLPPLSMVSWHDPALCPDTNIGRVKQKPELQHGGPRLFQNPRYSFRARPGFFRDFRLLKLL